MNYKKIIRSRKVRMAILSMLKWIPDSLMVKLQYRLHMGHWANLSNPLRLTEKLQVYKLNYRDPLMLRCTDKYEVRKVVEEFGLGHLLIPLVGVWDNPSDIDFESLPDAFVAKTTDGGGGSQVFVCRDKSGINRKEFESLLKSWINAPKTANMGREWAYDNGFPRRIIIEELIRQPECDELYDYKFLCFHGVPKVVYGISGRVMGKGAKFGIYTPSWEMLPCVRLDEFPPETPMPKPENYDEMLRTAGELSRRFPHVRVDLYNTGGKIYFGELTFYDSAGYIHFSPESFDVQFGSYFNTDTFIKKK